MIDYDFKPISHPYHLAPTPNLLAEVVEWLTPSTEVRDIAGSIPTEGMFSEKYLRLELYHVQMHGHQESPKCQPN